MTNSSSKESALSIPTIDISAAPDTCAYTKTVEQFKSAYSELGFGMIINHGIDPSWSRALFQASRDFHALPLAQKMSLSLNENHRGYIPIDTSTDVNSTLARVRKPNQSESFMIMREDSPDSLPVTSGAYLAGPNQWPDLAGFRETVERYIEAVQFVAQRLITISAAAIGVNAEQLQPLFNPATIWLRLLHYPPSPAHSPDDLYGSAPHTDFGALTLLAQDDVGGLQVLAPDGRWLDVPPTPGALVVNVGDMLQRISNGILKSTPHRVINTSGRERYSCVFFYDPFVNTTIIPHPQCVASHPPVQFDALHYGDFLRSELQAAYVQHQQQD